MANQAMDEFFDMLRTQGLKVTYEDLLLEPDLSDVFEDLSTVSLVSRFSRNVGLNVPIVSAAMDTVTEAAMAIAMVKLGGLGTIHRGMTPEEQAKHVARVKHCLHGFISAPITMRDTDTVAVVQSLRIEKGYAFESFPILNEQGQFVGLVTGNDLDVAEHEDVLDKTMMPLSKLITGKPGMSKDEAFTRMKQRKVKVIPLVDADGHLVGMYCRKDLLRIRKGSSNYNVASDGRLRVAAAIGVSEGEFERGLLLAEKGCDALVIDMSHGHAPKVAEMIRRLRAAGVACDLVAGNVSTAKAALYLADAGVDGIRVGQGPGSICTTRIMSGMGVPQGSAVYDCARALRERNVHARQHACGYGRDAGRGVSDRRRPAEQVVSRHGFARCDAEARIFQ